MHYLILKAEERIQKAIDHGKEVVKKVQAKCKHPAEYVHEADWQPETTTRYSSPPFLICTKCGLAEKGWGIGYHVLPETGTKMDRKRAQTFVRYTIDEEEKCKIWKENGRK